jgi:hypothetical protein
MSSSIFQLVVRAALSSGAILLVSACVGGPSGFGTTVYAPTLYTEPAYPMPGPGFHWAFHANYGWGWHHPSYGWSAGWR